MSKNCADISEEFGYGSWLIRKPRPIKGKIIKKSTKSLIYRFLHNLRFFAKLVDNLLVLYLFSLDVNVVVVLWSEKGRVFQRGRGRIEGRKGKTNKELL